MAEINKNVKPILEMFSIMIQHPNVRAVLGNWREMLSKGMFNFGRKEQLNDDLDFNLLIYTDINPKPNRTGSKIVLDPTVDIVGVVTNKRYLHPKWQYLKSEMLVVKARGKWDYGTNRGFRNIKIDQKVTLRVPPSVDLELEKNKDNYISAVAKQCFAWLVVNRMAHGQ